MPAAITPATVAAAPSFTLFCAILRGTIRESTCQTIQPSTV